MTLATKGMPRYPVLASAALRVHVIVSHQYEHAQPLLEVINAGLRRLQREQRLPAMLQKHQALQQASQKPADKASRKCSTSTCTARGVTGLHGRIA